MKEIKQNSFKGSSRGGFSLLETVIVATLALGTIFVLASLRKNAMDIENLVNQRLRSRIDFAQSFQMMVTDIRSASLSNLGAYPVISASTSSFSFYGDTDGDGLFDQVRYFLASTTAATTTLRRGVIRPTGMPLTYTSSSEVIRTLVDNLIISTTTPLFTYYGSSPTSTSSTLPASPLAEDVRAVKIAVYADIKPNISPQPEFFTTSVTIRNLRD